LLGERSPIWDPDARGAFVGIGRHHTRRHLVRAVLESIGYNLLTSIHAFRESGATIDRIDAVGGGAQSDVLLQILADVWGVPVRRRTIVEEANSLGAAVTGAVGLDLADFAAARALSEVTAEFTPDAAQHRVYADRHGRFTAAYDALAPWFAAGPAAATATAPAQSGGRHARSRTVSPDSSDKWRVGPRSDADAGRLGPRSNADAGHGGAR